MQFVHKLRLEGSICCIVLNRIVQHSLMEGPSCTIRNTEFGMFSKGNVSYRLKRRFTDQSLSEQVRILNRLSEECVTQLIHLAIGQQHQTIWL